MRAVLTSLAGVIFLFGLGAGASAESGGGAADPELTALRVAIADFKNSLVGLREACAHARERAVAEECRVRYAELRREYRVLKDEAMALARRASEWRARSRDEAARFANEQAKEDAQQQELAGLKGKSLQAQLRWVENHMLELRVDMDLFQQRAKEARAAAEHLSGQAHDEAVAIAERWERKAAAYADELKRGESQRQSLLAAVQSAKSAPKEAKQDAPKGAPGYDKLAFKLKALEEHLAQDRADLEAARGAGDTEKVALLEKGLVEHEAERAELLRQLASAKEYAKDKLTSELKSLDDVIAYKRGEQAKADAMAKAMRAAADQVSGPARDEFLAKAAKYDAAAKEWAALAEKYEAERKQLHTMLDLTLR